MLGISKGGISGWDDPLVIVGLIAAVVLLPLFVLDRARAAARRCSTSTSSATGCSRRPTGAAFINGLSRFALLFVFVFYFQGAQGDDPITAGIKLTPMAIGMLVASPLAGWWADRHGSRALAALGMVVSAVGPRRHDDAAGPLALLAEHALARARRASARECSTRRTRRR